MDNLSLSKSTQKSKRTIRTPNEIIINGNYAEMFMYDKYSVVTGSTKIDVEDIDKIKNHKWSLVYFKDVPYVKTNLKGSSSYLPNIIMGFKPSLKIKIDHIDRNTLNNRKSNFRIATHAQNLWNRGPSKNNKSGYKGVSWDKEKLKWEARIMSKGKLFLLGRYSKKIDAAKVYNEAAIKYHGEFAWLNPV